MRSGRSVFARAVVGLVASLAVMVMGAGAGAAQQQPEPRPPVREPTFLWLLTSGTNGSVRFANLTCDPAGGSHPEADAACRDLAAARGDFGKLPGLGGGACPDVYAPVSVAAFGVWRGTPVSYQARYGNACELRLMTGPVFQL
jgi:alkanesulfonate monooxygenase SsuD/methylene tetrahydromethanopterin reductase-like flavin-dependent oxidoreductase (luciferase family)